MENHRTLEGDSTRSSRTSPASIKGVGRTKFSIGEPEDCTGEPEDCTGEPEDNFRNTGRSTPQSERRLQTKINQVSDGTRQAAMKAIKPSTFKIPTFDRTDPRELHYKYFEAAAAHNQWTDMEKAVGRTVHIKGARSRCSQYCPGMTPTGTLHTH